MTDAIRLISIGDLLLATLRGDDRANKLQIND